MALGLSRSEQWTLLAVVGVILAGITYRSWHADDAPAPGAVVDAAGRWVPIAEVRASAGATTPSLPTSRGPRGGLDLNRATAADLERLPGIGPVRARDILAHRERIGRFRRVEDLIDVRGIGPATLERLRPFVYVADGDRPTTDSLGQGTSAAGAPTTATDRRAPQAPSAPIDLNTADAAQLERLPGIGPVLAQRIVEDRRARGPYRRPSDLLRVRGIGPATLERLLPYVRVE